MTQITITFPNSPTPQSVSNNAVNTTAAASINSADYLTEMLAGLVVGLEAQQTGTAASTGTMLPENEPAGSTSTTGVNTQSLEMMGDAVGIGMASTSSPVDWGSFVQQTNQTFSAAGVSQSDIDAYLGAVMQGYTQSAASGGSLAHTNGPFGGVGPAVTKPVTLRHPGMGVGPASINTSASSQQPLTVPPPSIGAGMGPASVNTNNLPPVIAGAYSSYAIPTNMLPGISTSASGFTAAGVAAFNEEAPTLGSSVNINALVANTQQEMMAAGYSQDQINGYMTGLYEAYNASPAGQLPSSNTQQSNNNNNNQPDLLTT